LYYQTAPKANDYPKFDQRHQNLTLTSFHSSLQPLISPGILAYSFGLRHAVDADHIATIDNVTRKLIQDGKRPITV
jgi:high-affinity nickel permease